MRLDPSALLHAALAEQVLAPSIVPTVRWTQRGAAPASLQHIHLPAAERMAAASACTAAEHTATALTFSYTTAVAAGAQRLLQQEPQQQATGSFSPSSLIYAHVDVIVGALGASAAAIASSIGSSMPGDSNSVADAAGRVDPLERPQPPAELRAGATAVEAPKSASAAVVRAPATASGAAAAGTGAGTGRRVTLSEDRLPHLPPLLFDPSTLAVVAPASELPAAPQPHPTAPTLSYDYRAVAQCAGSGARASPTFLTAVPLPAGVGIVAWSVRFDRVTGSVGVGLSHRTPASSATLLGMEGGRASLGIYGDRGGLFDREPLSPASEQPRAWASGSRVFVAVDGCMCTVRSRYQLPGYR